MEDPFPSLWDHYASSLTELLDCADEKSNSLGFMELLNMHDSAAFQEEDHHPNPNPNPNSKLHDSFNAPQTPNCSSISSESSDRLLISKDEEEDADEEDDNDHKKKTTKQSVLSLSMSLYILISLTRSVVCVNFFVSLG